MISSTDEAYWRGLETLLLGARLIVDRPRGRAHPRHPELIYPLDYGYLEGSASGDAAGIDVWLGSTGNKKLTGILCTFDRVKRDLEVKLLCGCTPQEVETVLNFNQRILHYLYIPRPQEA